MKETMICGFDLIEKVVHGRVYNGLYLINLFCHTVAKGSLYECINPLF